MSHTPLLGELNHVTRLGNKMLGLVFQLPAGGRRLSHEAKSLSSLSQCRNPFPLQMWRSRTFQFKCENHQLLSPAFRVTQEDPDFWVLELGNPI